MADEYMSLARFFVCPKCVGPFVDPRMLPCLHTLCYKCLNEHVGLSGKEGHFGCPVCQTTVAVPSSGAEAFQKNSFVADHMSLHVDNTAQAEDGTKLEGKMRALEDNCCANFHEREECTDPEKFCKDCCEYFCKDCSTAHRRFKILRDHVLVSIKDLTEEIVAEALFKPEVLKCQEHTDEHFKLYCATCKTVACSICRYISHMTHDVREVSKVDSDVRAELESAMANLQAMMDKTTRKSENVKTFQQNIQGISSAAMATCKTLFEKMRLMLNKEADRVRDKITRVSSEGGEQADSQSKNLELQLRQLGKSHSFIWDLLHKGTVFNRLATLKDVRVHLQQILSSSNLSEELAPAGDVPSASAMILDSFEGLVLEEVVSTQDIKEVKITQKCCVMPDKTDVHTQTDRVYIDRSIQTGSDTRHVDQSIQTVNLHANKEAQTIAVEIAPLDRSVRSSPSKDHQPAKLQSKLSRDIQIAEPEGRYQRFGAPEEQGKSLSVDQYPAKSKSTAQKSKAAVSKGTQADKGENSGRKKETGQSMTKETVKNDNESDQAELDSVRSDRSRQNPGLTNRLHVPQERSTVAACEALCKLLSTKDEEHTHTSVHAEALQKLTELYLKSRMEAVPPQILALPSSFLRAMVTSASRQGQWHRLNELLSQYRTQVLGEDHKWSELAVPCLAGAKYCRKDGNAAKLRDVVEDLACEVDVADYIRGDFSTDMLHQRSCLLELLLLFKASPHGSTNSCPVSAAIKKPDFKAIHTLLFFGASPRKLSLERGDSPFHAAAKIGLEKDTGNFDSLEVLFEIVQQLKVEYSELCSSACDSKGDTVFHIAAKADFSEQSLKLVEILCRNKVNPNLRNAKAKTALQCIPETNRDDLRSQHIRRVARLFSNAPPEAGSDQGRLLQDKKGSQLSMTTMDSGSNGEKLAKEIEGVKKSKGTAEGAAKLHESLTNSSKEKTRKNIRKLIQLLGSEEPLRSGCKDVLEENAGRFEQSASNLAMSTPTQCPKDSALLQTIVGSEGEVGAKNELETMADIDPSEFDGLEWEVDCTAKVLKVLKDIEVPLELKRCLVRKIHHLASGNWHSSLCKPFDSLPYEVFEAELSGETCFIWELTVDFSPRCSGSAEHRLHLKTNEPYGAKGGRIYSEIIRVWDIVVERKNIRCSIEQIINSHKKGSECIIQKSLQCIQKRGSRSCNTTASQRYPKIFSEPDAANRQKTHRRYFPPASPNDMEYNIMKFYSFSSALVQNVLENKDIKVDFPFKVTELEHAIINLRPQPPEPILLLGRSGTGKTTCCFNRLLNEFVRHWKQAEDSDGPLTPRSMTFACGDGSSAAKAALKTASSDCVGGAGGGADAEEKFDHLHQIFITKNPVLCTEVKKSFLKMSHACASARQHLEAREKTLPKRFQNALPAACPLFLTSRQFLLILDASIPPPFFFQRTGNYSLEREVKGWMDGDGSLTSIPEIPDVDDDELDDAVAPGAGAGAAAVITDQPNTSQRKPDLRREVTYEVFAFELWPKMKKKVKLDCHPTLVWMEITSFIEGSVEALNTSHGYLSCEDYKRLGRKRASNFSGDRDEIYKMFTLYRHLKQNKFLFDEGDVIFNLFQRLQKCGGVEWVIHQFFVDETQDFTQAELCLLLQCCQNPNNMFLTGDTAQSIMRGINFRFKDLISLFYYAKKSAEKLGKATAVEVPGRLYQLTHNYRSHAGILRLASSVVDLMAKFFPDSFDQLRRDQGLFDGPQPVLVESDNHNDLALLLLGNKRETSNIEFGAHQAILVASDVTRDRLPKELSNGLVLTIFQSKGLEFDDILLYNFFKDSQAQKEWRVVTDYIKSLDQGNDGTYGDGLVVELDKKYLETAAKSRPLQFDPGSHKVLNSELKHLYTALTRARVNIWIFDEDVTARAPMFEYFMARKLVHVLEAKDISIEEGLTKQTFAQQSSAQEWQKRGDEFYRSKQYTFAAECYSKSGDRMKERLSKTQQRVLNAARARAQKPAQMRSEFCFAAEEFLQLGLATEASQCLKNAREYQLAAELYKKMGQFKDAAEIFKKMGKVEEACRTCEDGKLFNDAAELLVEHAMFDEAIAVVGRYHIAVKDSGQPVPEKLLTNKPHKDQNQLSLEAAKHHFRRNQHDQMMTALDRLSDRDKINFLLERRLIREAVPFMQVEGRGSEIAQKFFDVGQFEEALEYADAEQHTELRGHCLLSLARKECARLTDLATQTISDGKLVISSQGKTAHNIRVEKSESRRKAEAFLSEAISIFNGRNDICSGEAKYMLGRSKQSDGRLREACIDLKDHDVGYVECIDSLSDIGKRTHIEHFRALDTLDRIWNLLHILKIESDRLCAENRKQIRLLYSFYGLEQVAPGRVRVAPTGAVVLHPFRKKALGQEVKEHAVISELQKRLKRKAAWWVESINNSLQNRIENNRQCPSYVVGTICGQSDCCMLHAPNTQATYHCLIRNVLAMIRLHSSKKKLSIKIGGNTKKSLRKLWQWCDMLLSTMYPRHAHPVVLASHEAAAKQVLGEIRSSPVKWLVRTLVQKSFEPKDDQTKDDKTTVDKTTVGEAKDDQTKCDETDSTDFCLKLHTLLCLFGDNPEHVENLLVDKACEQAIERNPGLKIFGVNRQEVACRTIMWNFYRAVESLHSTTPVKGLTHMQDFFGSIMRCGGAELIPSFANTARLMEIMTVWVTGFRLRHFQQSVAVLPASFLAAVNWWDAELHGMYEVRFFEGIKQSQSKDQSLVEPSAHYLVQVMCGDTPDLANVISEAFEEGNEVLDVYGSGEAERILVLALVLLINSGEDMPFPEKSEALLRTAIENIKISKNLGEGTKNQRDIKDHKDGNTKHHKDLQKHTKNQKNPDGNTKDRQDPDGNTKDRQDPDGNTKDRQDPDGNTKDRQDLDEHTEIHKPLDDYPRLATAVKMAKKSKNRHDVAHALLGLLNARDQEPLYMCSWRWGDNGDKGIYGEQIKSPENIPKRAYSPQPQTGAQADQQKFSRPGNRTAKEGRSYASVVQKT